MVLAPDIIYYINRRIIDADKIIMSWDCPEIKTIKAVTGIVEMFKKSTEKQIRVKLYDRPCGNPAPEKKNPPTIK